MSTPKNLRVLSLEDSALDAELILRELKKTGHILTWLRVDKREAYEQAIDEFQPDLILADYKLPAFDGMQALEMATHLRPDIPVIIISGAVGEETAVELLKNGATDFVLKDHLGRLVPAINRALKEVETREARRKAEADLRTLNEQLEERIEQRTRELSQKNAMMEEDLQMARELQMAFLPSHFPTIPQGVPDAASAVKFSSIFHPTNSVGGDFYNVMRISDTAIGIFICDVMGHGVRAALVTAMMRALEEQLGEAADDPGTLLTQLNQQLRGILQQLETTLFATACYIVVDVASGRLTYANAGHPDPLLIHSGSGKVDIIGTDHKHGPALGLMNDVPYQTHDLSLHAGDRILLFTDGLFEVENSQSQSFSESRLRESIRRRAWQPLPKLVQDISREIQDFAQHQEFTDDVCLVGVEVSRLESQPSATSRQSPLRQTCHA